MPPSSPAGFTQLSTSENAVVLAWTASSDNVGVVSYGVYRNLALVQSPSAPQVALGGLACGTSYEYAFDAADAAGNRSQLATAYVRTSDCPAPAPAPNPAPAPAPAPSDWAFCSNEWDSCAFSGQMDVRYGANGTFTSPRTFTDGVECTNAVFGDPLVGTPKQCQTRSSASTSPTPAPAPSPAPEPAPAPAPAPDDTQPPTAPASLAVSAASATGVSLRWNPSSDNVGVAGYRSYRDKTYVSTASQTATTISGLACGTAHTFEVNAFDEAGNSSARSSVIGSTLACPDAQAPTAPANVSVSSRTATSIALTWSASTDDVGVIGYGLYQGGASKGQSAGTTGIFTGLACNTNYTLALDAVDAAGNRSAKTTLMVSTTACPDTQAPSTPSGLGASNVTQTGLTLSWNASTDNVAVTGYDLYRDGTKVASPTSPSASQTGLACGTSYTFAVEALDAAGNRSSRATLGASTTACSPAPAPADWTFCSNENQYCSFTGTKEVRYGVNATFTSPRTLTGGVDCTNAVFGDPVVGTPKHCEVRSSGSTPSPSPSTATSGPITITAGGTYTGNWESTSSIPAITIATTQPVTIANSIVKNLSGGPLINAVPGGPVQVVVQNTFAYGGSSYQTSGRFLQSSNFKSVTIRNCTIENTRGIELELGAAGSSVLITRNKHHNIQGNGMTPVGNFVQFRSVQNSTVEVSWNQVINEYNKSNPEDLVSLYQSANANVHDNYFFGQSTPGNAYATSSQNGITIESGTQAGSASNNTISNNQLIAGEAIGMFSGNNNVFQGNRIVRSGFLTDGATLNRNGYEGIWISTNGTNNHAHGNVVGFVNRDGARSDGRFPGAPEGDTGEWANNTHMPSPISLSVEQNEWTLWQQKLAANGISVGA